MGRRCVPLLLCATGLVIYYHSGGISPRRRYSFCRDFAPRGGVAPCLFRNPRTTNVRSVHLPNTSSLTCAPRSPLTLPLSLPPSRPPSLVRADVHGCRPEHGKAHASAQRHLATIAAVRTERKKQRWRGAARAPPLLDTRSFVDEYASSANPWKVGAQGRAVCVRSVTGWRCKYVNLLGFLLFSGRVGEKTSVAGRLVSRVGLTNPAKPWTVAGAVNWLALQCGVGAIFIPPFSEIQTRWCKSQIGALSTQQLVQGPAEVIFRLPRLFKPLYDCMGCKPIP